MAYLTGSVASSGRSIGDLIRTSYQEDAPQQPQQDAASIIASLKAQKQPMVVTQQVQAPPMVQMQPVFRPQVIMQRQQMPQQPQMSATAQRYADIYNGNGQPMSEGQFKQSKLDGYNAEMALKAQQQQMQPQYEQLWRDYQRSVASQLLAQNNGTANQNSIGSQIAAQVLAGQGGIMANGGQYGMAAGNQSVAQLRELQAQGVFVPPAIMQAAIDQDQLWNLDGDKEGLKGIGSLAYRSMGIAGGSYTGNNSTYAYGANAFDDNGMWNQNSGANYFEYDNIGYNRKQLDDIKRGWANDNRYSKNPMGSYGGPAGDGKNVHQYGNPNVDTGNNNNYQWQPPFVSPKGPVHDNNEINDGFASHDGNGNRTKAYVPTKQDTRDQFRQGVDDWRQFYGDKGYDYMPKSGNGSGWNAGANESRRNMGFGANQPAAAIAGAPEVKAMNIANPENDVFSDITRTYAKPPLNEQRYSNAFDRYAFDPITGGVVEGMLEKRAGKKK